MIYVFVGCLTFMFVPQTVFSQKTDSNPSLIISKPAEVKIRNETSTEKINLNKSDSKLTKKNKHQKNDSNLEMKQRNNGGVYISVGGVLLVILILILIL